MDFQRLMDLMAETLDARGYDMYEVQGIGVLRQGGFQIYYEAIDSFQSDLDYSDRVASGYSQSFFFEDEADFWSKLADIPTRETREFRVLLQRTAGLKLLSSAMVGAAGRAFAAEMAATLEKYKLLEAK
ncbi:MAG: hypothetical protein E6Q97_33005 [Desulfurellales bacterium]|nr:MAG: hypothetical protein E6Q97_33005 [Desulfurellales bacterium]